MRFAIIAGVLVVLVLGALYLLGVGDSSSTSPSPSTSGSSSDLRGFKIP